MRKLIARSGGLLVLALITFLCAALLDRITDPPSDLQKRTFDIAKKQSVQPHPLLASLVTRTRVLSAPEQTWSLVFVPQTPSGHPESSLWRTAADSSPPS